MGSRIGVALSLLALCACIDRSILDVQLASGASMSVAPNPLPADGVSAADVRIQLLNRSGPLVNNVVTIYSDNPNARITQALPTDAQGITHAAVRSSVAGTQVITAALTNGGMHATLPIGTTVTFLDANRVELTLASSETLVVDDGVSTALLTATLTQGGLPLAGLAATFVSSDSRDTLTVLDGVTDAQGQAAAPWPTATRRPR